MNILQVIFVAWFVAILGVAWLEYRANKAKRKAELARFAAEDWTVNPLRNSASGRYRYKLHGED